MKKIAGLLLTVVSLVTMLTAFAVPALAEGDEPVEFVPDGSLDISDSGNYIISSGNYVVDYVAIKSGCTLTIGKDAIITVTDSGSNKGTIIVLGTLNVDGYLSNLNTIRVVQCVGKITGNVKSDPVIYDDHIYDNGVCTVCGHICANSFHNGVCSECGMGTIATGSIFSEGSLAIITAVAGIAVGMAVMFFIMKKKKKSVLADGVEDNDGE